MTEITKFKLDEVRDCMEGEPSIGNSFRYTRGNMVVHYSIAHIDYDEKEVRVRELTRSHI